MTQDNDQCQAGKVVGGVVGVAACFFATPILFLTGRRAGAEIMKRIFGACVRAGGGIQKEFSKKSS